MVCCLIYNFKFAKFNSDRRLGFVNVCICCCDGCWMHMYFNELDVCGAHNMVFNRLGIGLMVELCALMLLVGFI